MPRDSPVACELCGTPTESKYGLCRKTPECNREYMRRYYAANREAVLAQPARLSAANREEKRAYSAAYRAANREKMRALTAAWRKANRDVILERRRSYDATYREATRASKKEQNAAHYAANRDAILARKAALREAKGRPARSQGKSQAAAERERERRRERQRRDDLPCRYAKFGCTNLKVRNSAYCRPHRKAAERRRLKRQQQAMKLRRAHAQDWACTWCGRPLPADLGEAHQDHVIPRAATMASLGRIINDEWNMDILHAACNLAKADTLTPRAIALAAEHGIDLLAPVVSRG